MQIQPYLKQLYSKYYQNSIVLRRFSKVFSLDVLVRASNFFLLPIYLKLMTKDEYGLYGYFYSIIWIFSLILNFGLYLAQTKLYHDYDEEGRKSLIFTINTSLCLLLIVTLFPIYAFGIDYHIVKIIFLHNIAYESYRGYLILAIVVAVFSFMFGNFFITSENIKKLQIFNFLKLVLVNSIVIYALMDKSSDTVKTRLEYSYFTELFIVLLFVPYYIKNMKFKYDYKIARRAFKIGIPSMLISIVSLVYNFSDRFILEKYGSFSDLAIYNLGFTLASIIGVVYTSFQSVYLPFFYKEKDFDKSFSKSKNISKKMTGIFVVLSICIWIGAYFLLHIGIIDKKYYSVLYVLPFLLLSQNIQSLSLFYTNYIVYFEVVYVGTIITIVLSILNVGLNLLLIPGYNYVGASISSFIVSTLSFIVYFFYAKSRLNKISII